MCGGHTTRQLEHYDNATEGPQDSIRAMLQQCIALPNELQTHNLTMMQLMASNCQRIYQITPWSHNLHLKSSSHHLGLVKKNYHYIKPSN